jgi:hypothetical protein
MNSPFRTTLAALCVFVSLAVTASARDRMAMPWQEFSERSTLVFSGQLLKAEIIPDADRSRANVRCSYKVYDTFKGDAVPEVTFDAPLRDQASTEVGTLALVFLRRDGSRSRAVFTCP